MTAIAGPTLCPGKLEQAGSASRVRGRFLLGLAIVAIPAVLLRFWGIDAPFESGDQVAMSYLLKHSFGVKWLFAHEYGLGLAVYQRTFAEMLSRLGLPMGEVAGRIPVVLISFTQIAMCWLLLRRLHCSRSEATAGALCCVVMPQMVNDAHYPWAYMSVWFLFGTISLWATLAYVDDRRWWQLGLSGVCLMLHCLSGAYSFALPLTVLIVWCRSVRDDRQEHGGGGRRLWLVVVAYVLPCLTALAVMVGSWWWTGGGQIGRILMKRGMGGFDPHFEQILELPALWSSQLGVVFSIVTAMAMMAGVRALFKGTRYGLLVFWGWAGLLPIVLVDNWDATGYAMYHLFEPLAISGLVAAVWLCRTYRQSARLRPVVAVVAFLALAQMFLAGVEICTASDGLYRYTGVRTGWGDVRPDTGLKAAGWYIREHVPMERTVYCVHTNDGMEVTVGEYYTGRRVLAGYDVRPEMVEPLLREMLPDVDVIIVDPERCWIVDSLQAFERVCTFRREGQPVRYIYARRKCELPKVDEDVAAINPRYDQRYTPRHIPVGLPSSPGFSGKLIRFQETVRQLKRNRSFD